MLYRDTDLHYGHFFSFGFNYMQVQESEQIKSILSNFESSRKSIPYFSDLVQHPSF
jgi:hypothetical protein